jgi:hypothetical protein
MARCCRRLASACIDAPHDIGAASEKDGGVLGLKRLESSY